MNQDTLLSWYDKLEKLVTKLPGPLQKAILNELQPVKQLFLEQRPARILLLGTSTTSRIEVVNSLFREQVASHNSEKNLPVAPGWETFKRGAGGTVQLIDAREQKNLLWSSGREEFAPDLILFAVQDVAPEKLQPALDLLAQALVEIDARFDLRPTVFGVVETDVFGANGRTAPAATLETALRGISSVNKALAQVVSIPRWSRFRADGTPDDGPHGAEDLNHLMTLLVDELPTQAKLEMARISGVRPAQKKIADTLIKATAAVAAAVGAQPIPLADLPILAGIQSSMVAGIIYISGGEMNLRSALKFLASLGVTLGVAIALREVARGAAKLVPGFGYAVSGGVAAAGTFAIGRAAQAFFIDGLTLPQAREIFRRKSKNVTPKPANPPKLEQK